MGAALKHYRGQPRSTEGEALASKSNASIRGFYRLALRAIDAYSAAAQYGTEECT